MTTQLPPITQETRTGKHIVYTWCCPGCGQKLEALIEPREYEKTLCLQCLTIRMRRMQGVRSK